MKDIVGRLIGVDANERRRDEWVVNALGSLPSGAKMLDAGAGEQRYRAACQHLEYVAQDFCQYDGQGDQKGLQMGQWRYGGIDIVSDITAIPLPSESLDAILCTEVLEHIPDPLRALDEFRRLLRPGGTLILTAPFSSLVHLAPFFFSTGFSRYWYQEHLAARGMTIIELVGNGDWFALIQQELLRLPRMARVYIGAVGWLTYPLAAVMALLVAGIRCLGSSERSHEAAVFGFHCRAIKDEPPKQ